MTSSLVGSEMCIRDSCKPEKLMFCYGSRCISNSSCARSVAMGKSVPVSYTHLTLPTICSV
eukprot:11993528-Prorocentrum_lima.AAC.1